MRNAAALVKQANRRKIYSYIYSRKTVSKQEISENLRLALSTVTQNLTELEKEGLIERSGSYASTGGRKPKAIRIVSQVRIAVGIGILKDTIHIAGVDLYGNIVSQLSLPRTFSDTEDYYRELGTCLCAFIQSSGWHSEQILGVALAIQGIVSTDGLSVSYGTILGNTNTSLSRAAFYIPFPCRLEHDSKAAAYREIWHKPEFSDSIVLLLNPNLGGALVTGQKVHRGLSMHSGAIEHMCLDPHGPLCYCGQNGCLETYCSAEALRTAANMPLPEFFSSLRTGDGRCQNIWNSYLTHLARAIRNLNMIYDVPIICSGYLASFLRQTDLEELTRLFQNLSPFPVPNGFFSLSSHGELAPAAGAALPYIDEFLNTI